MDPIGTGGEGGHILGWGGGNYWGLGGLGESQRYYRGCRVLKGPYGFYRDSGSSRDAIMAAGS